MNRTDIDRAQDLLRRYKAGKVNLERRIVANEQWFRLRHWDPAAKEADPAPAGAWLFNAIANKHADAMDNYPEPAVLPRERDDEADARLLSQVLPAVLEYNEFEQTYSDMWWYKLKTGTGVLGVFWDPALSGGLGDVRVRSLDLLNLFWEPGVTDIQLSPNLFHVELDGRDRLARRWPGLDVKQTGAALDVAKYVYDDMVDTSDKALVVDWYYKKDGRVHLCKFCMGQVLYASEDDPAYALRGYYDHGQYPFVLDTLFPAAGTPAGFGYIDVCKGTQSVIDRLDQAILRHALMGAHPRFFVRGDGAVNEEEFADWQRELVHYQGAGDPRDSVLPIPVPAMPQVYATVRQLKVDELKETSGNRDFSQGSTSSGVTAASAIAALQEAGSKLSRDMISSSYRAFSKVCGLCIRLMGQFYREDRYFRVAGAAGRAEFLAFNGHRLDPRSQGSAFGVDLGVRQPVFDIKVVSQKSSPFAQAAQNERAKELYRLGFFRPDLAPQALAALDMMRFDGVDRVRQQIRENAGL